MKGTMRAAIFEGNGVITIKKVEIPKIQKGDDMILKIEVCSICGTDVHVLSVPPGYDMEPNHILGHELVGEIIEIGESVINFKVGDRVVVNPNDYCGVCKYCQMNLPNQCENIIPMGLGGEGGFCEYTRVSEKVAYKISDNLPAEIAAFAEPLACTVNGINKIKANPGDSVTIIGAGPIGLLFVQLMKASGAYPIIVSEPSELRREYALKSGADYAINPMENDLDSFVKEKTVIGSDFAIDVVGSQLPAAIKVVRKGGKVLLFGVNKMAHPEVTQSEIIFKEISVLGTWLANATFPKAVQILESGVLDLKELVTHTFPLEKLEDGIQLLRRGEGIEVIIDMSL
jgi:2-desacetyl-2-hydroxyethyl bacteriochlorophyllide A dehydrogenase